MRGSDVKSDFRLEVTFHHRSHHHEPVTGSVSIREWNDSRE
jgi:hypothetical protein